MIYLKILKTNKFKHCSWKTILMQRKKIHKNFSLSFLQLIDHKPMSNNFCCKTFCKSLLKMLKKNLSQKILSQKKKFKSKKILSQKNSKWKKKIF